MGNLESLVGGQLGQFQIKDELGRGGMAVVYKGYQPSLDRWVAIKTLPQEFAGKREMVSRFHREAEAMVSLNHSNIVQIIDKGEDKGLYYFAMELVQGPSLQEMLKEQRSKDLMFDVAQQVAEGLDYAHKKGIVHRDIKPGNILWESATSLAKIADFGIARLTQKPEEMITLTAMNVGMGTMNYMAPEQKTDAATVDHRADIYSLGVMIYEMFTGTLPMGRFKMPSALDPSLPKKLDEIVVKCMEPDPEERYASMADLQADLSVARQQGGNDGTLVRSVRDAAERTLTAIAGEEHKGKAGFACCLFIMLGLGVGSFAAYSKGMIPGVGPAEVASKTKTKATKTRPRTDDDEKTDGDEKTGDDPPSKTGDDPPSKTGDDPPPSKTGDDPPPSKTGDDPPPSKTGDDPPPSKTGDDPPPSKTGDDPPPSKTGDDPPPSKTGDDPPPSKTGDDPPPSKTGDDPPPTKTGGEETPPKNGNGTKPVVTKLDPVLQREFSELERAAKKLLASAKQSVKRWGLKSAGLTKALEATGAAAAAKPGPATLKALRGDVGALESQYAAALGAAVTATIKDAEEHDELEVRRDLKRAGEDFRAAATSRPEGRIPVYRALLSRLAARRAAVARARADAVLAAARQRGSGPDLAPGLKLYSAGNAALTARRLDEARLKYQAAQAAFQAVQPAPPRRVKFLAKAFAHQITRAPHFGSIAPAPGGGIFAVCKRTIRRKSVASLHLIRAKGESLREVWSVPLDDGNAYTVASAGVDASGNYLVWIGTQVGARNLITQFRFDSNGGKAGKGAEIPLSEWIHDMDVGSDGRLYVLAFGKILSFSGSQRVKTLPYDQTGMSPLPLHPRRLALLSDNRAVVSGLMASGRPRELTPEKTSEWSRAALQVVHVPTKQTGSIPHGTTTPFAITGVGKSLVVHDHGPIQGEQKRRHLVTYPQGEGGVRLSHDVGIAERPTLSTDMAYSGGVLYVLDTFKIVPKTILGRTRIVAYTVSDR